MWHGKDWCSRGEMGLKRTKAATILGRSKVRYVRVLFLGLIGGLRLRKVRLNLSTDSEANREPRKRTTKKYSRHKSLL